jgi:hypothetical protein
MDSINYLIAKTATHPAAPRYTTIMLTCVNQRIKKGLKYAVNATAVHQPHKTCLLKF